MNCKKLCYIATFTNINSGHVLLTLNIKEYNSFLQFVMGCWSCDFSQINWPNIQRIFPLSLSLSWSIFMQGKSESLLDRRHYNFRLNAPANTKKKLIKLKDVNSLVYQMESLGSKTASCITPEELRFPLHRNASLFILYLYHQWFWSMFLKKTRTHQKI